MDSVPTAADIAAYPSAAYDFDGFDATTADVSNVHAAGAKAICYLDFGGAETYRPDYAQYPASVLGNVISGWPQERWVDLRQESVLAPIFNARLATCESKHFDAVEPDQYADVYQPDNNSGISMTASDELTAMKWIVGLIHAHAMSAISKNGPEFSAQMAPLVEGELNEQCAEYNECDTLSPYIAAGKVVWDFEYTGNAATFCPALNSLGIMGQKKALALTAPRTLC